VTRPAASPRDPEAEYYQSVEEFFVSRRGDPLFLSNPDWLLVREWRRQGVPLRIVLRGIADALESHANSFSRHRKVSSLVYCRNEVEAARQRWERALADGEQEGVATPDFLVGLAEKLRSAPGLGPRAGGLVPELVSGLAQRAAGDLPIRALEPWLQAEERRLIGALRADMGEEAVGRLEAEVEADLAAYRDRLPERVLSEVRSESLARRALECHGLPRLSLFVL
jgi:hypothetical protein